MNRPTVATVAKIAAAAIAVRVTWRLGKLVYNVLTSVPPAADLPHTCIPPTDFLVSASTQKATRAFIQENYPELMDLVDRGNLVVMQPAAILAEVLAKHRAQQPCVWPVAVQQAPGAGAAEGAEASSLPADGPCFTEQEIADLLSSPQLQQCLARPLPELLVFVGTVHVAKQSADDVTKVIKVLFFWEGGYSRSKHTSKHH